MQIELICGAAGAFEAILLRKTHLLDIGSAASQRYVDVMCLCEVCFLLCEVWRRVARKIQSSCDFPADYSATPYAYQEGTVRMYPRYPAWLVHST